MGTRILTVEDDERIRTSVRLALEDGPQRNGHSNVLASLNLSAHG